MNIAHVALWTNQLDQLRSFYETYFQATSGNVYRNPINGFESYFLSFSTGARLELMQQPGVQNPSHGALKIMTGYAHLSLATGSEKAVNELTVRLQRDGFQVLRGPRQTGDGYFESMVLDPDGNQVEITV